MIAWTKGVSRSFYLSLRLLPEAMRDAAALGYLLARTSDTLADSTGLPAGERLAALTRFADAVKGTAATPEWSTLLLHGVSHPGERELLGRTGALLTGLRGLHPSQADLVREVVATIISGQQLDLTRFATAGPERPVPLPDEVALEDYAWRVAGCVGEFWTKLGFAALGPSFSTASEESLLPLARSYGMGLQLVNILRDLPADLAAGRCYLPVNDPTSRTDLLDAHAAWLVRAREQVACGRRYSSTIRSRRLRAASLLPALLAESTLDLLSRASWETLRTGVKVPRRRVYPMLLRAFFS